VADTAHAAHVGTHTEAHSETSTGLDSRKLAIWTFIGSECLFFASLIGTYLVYRGRSLVGPFPHEEWVSPAGVHFEPILEIKLVTVARRCCCSARCSSCWRSMVRSAAGAARRSRGSG